MLSRVQGSLVAAVAGDCIGALFEMKSQASLTRAAILKAVERIEKEYSEQKKKEAAGKKMGASELLDYTDDTAMARCIVASIVDKKRVDELDIGARFAAEFKEDPGRGYGGNVGTVLHALSDPTLSDIFQPAREQFDGSGSYGNGGAMRISPLALFCFNQPLAELTTKAVRITELTHSHPHAIVGSVLQTFAVRLSLSLDSARPLDAGAFLDTLLKQLAPVERDIYVQHRSRKKTLGDAEEGSEAAIELPYCDKLQLMQDFLGREVTTEEVEERLGNNISALGSVPTAVYCFLRGAAANIEGFEKRSEVEQAILYAIMLGGDTDTIATMAAAISGAFYGLEAVPQAWQWKCEGVCDAMKAGEQIAKLIATPS